ncbi:MAG: hypothetical protein H0X26_05385 [Alphaproteobacteria bacterium]|nr:hypothetical protein [Alphaproteobacteria bacterium]
MHNPFSVKAKPVAALRATRSNPESPQKDWIASKLTLPATTALDVQIYL